MFANNYMASLINTESVINTSSTHNDGDSDKVLINNKLVQSAFHVGNLKVGKVNYMTQ